MNFGVLTTTKMESLAVEEYNEGQNNQAEQIGLL